MIEMAVALGAVTCVAGFATAGWIMCRRDLQQERRINAAAEAIQADALARTKANLVDIEARLHNLRSNALLADFNGWHQYYWNCKPEVRERAEAKGYVRV